MEKRYDVGRYQEGCQAVRDLKSYVDSADIPENIKLSLLSNIKKAIGGTIQASKEIYSSEKEPIVRHGSESDWETDKKDLENLTFFE